MGTVLESMSAGELAELAIRCDREMGKRSKGGGVGAALRHASTADDGTGVDVGKESDRQAVNVRRPFAVTLENLDRAMAYQPWSPDQVEAGNQIREALTAAARAILRNTVPTPLQTLAINMLIDARMVANAAITFRGEF